MPITSHKLEINSVKDLKTDLYIILAGDSAKEALKRFGIEISIQEDS